MAERFAVAPSLMPASRFGGDQAVSLCMHAGCEQIAFHCHIGRRIRRRHLHGHAPARTDAHTGYQPVCRWGHSRCRQARLLFATRQVLIARCRLRIGFQPLQLSASSDQRQHCHSSRISHNGCIVMLIAPGGTGVVGFEHTRSNRLGICGLERTALQAAARPASARNGFGLPDLLRVLQDGAVAGKFSHIGYVEDDFA